MSSPSIPSSPLPGTLAEVSALPPPPKPIIFVVSAVISTPAPAPAQSKKGGKPAKVKVSKEEKTKEFSFIPTKTNYVAFLLGILTKYGEQSRRVSTPKHVYPFKYYHKRLRLNKSTALSVDNADEYEQLVDKISKHELETVHILVKMADVDNKCPKRSSGDGDSDSGSEDDESSATQASKEDKLSPMEKQLAQHRLAIEKRYQVSDGYWEFDFKKPGVQPLVLTPFLIREWSLAIVDGKATLENPPHTGPFDPRAQRRTSLLTSTPMGSPATTGVDLAQVTSLLTAVAGIVQPRVLPEGVPSTPTRSVTAAAAIPPSPSDLTRFLTWAAVRPEYQLPDAQRYEDKLRQESFDPDVILDLARDDLTSSPVRMTKGNAMRLKRACEAWWNAPDGKRLRPLPSLLDTTASGSKEQDIEVQYELRWIEPDGTVTGMNRWFGPPMRRDENWTGMSTPPDPAIEGKVFYLDTARGGQWVEVPPDYIIVKPSDKASDFE